MSTDPHDSLQAQAAVVAPSAPSWLLSLVEAPRALSEASTLLPAHRFLQSLEPGDGHTVVTIPGFMATGRSMAVARRYLSDWGYEAQSWALGRNFGMLRGRSLQAELDARIAELADASGRKVSLVGWSLGGLLAREAARRQPAHVRNVIALGSPLGDPKATNAWRLFELVSGYRVSDEEIARRVARLREPVPGVPTTAVYSRSDSIVSWQIAQLPEDELVESVAINSGSHLGMGFNPSVLYLIADRLRQAEGAWQPFEVSGLRRLFFE